MRRTTLPTVSPIGQQTLDAYERVFRNEEDLMTAVTIRNYLSDLCHRFFYIDSLKLWGMTRSIPHSSTFEEPGKICSRR